MGKIDGAKDDGPCPTTTSKVALHHHVVVSTSLSVSSQINLVDDGDVQHVTEMSLTLE